MIHFASKSVFAKPFAIWQGKSLPLANAGFAATFVGQLYPFGGVKNAQGQDFSPCFGSLILTKIRNTVVQLATVCLFRKLSNAMLFFG